MLGMLFDLQIVNRDTREGEFYKCCNFEYPKQSLSYRKEMLFRIRRLSNTIFNIGIEYAHTISEQKRLRLLNQLTFICLVISAIVLINELFRNDIKGFFIDLAVVSPLLLCFFFNKKGWLDLAKRTFVVFVVLLLTTALVFYGRACGGEYAYLVTVAFTFIFFLKKEEVIYLNLFIGFCFLFTQVYLFYYLPIHPVIHIPNVPLIASLICQIFIVFAFVQENKSFDQKTQTLLDELSQKNRKLDQQKTLIEAKNTELLNANKELESFAYATSHDLRSPLRNIVSFIDLFNYREGKTLSEKGKEYLGFIRGSARQMNQLVSDILRHASLNTEELIEAVDLNEVIKKVAENLLSTKDGETNIKIEFLPTIKVNRVKMELLFQNLIENGIKYNKELVPEVKVGIERNDRHFLISIKDNGIGIEKEYHSKIFEMFKRLHGQGEYNGTGIGLATCKKIVENYNGDISVKEGLKKGTEFIIKFPLSIEALEMALADT